MSQTNWPEPERIFADKKPGIRYYLIIAALPQLPSELDKEAYHGEALKIRNYLDEKVKRAVAYEAEGKTELALQIFLELVKENYDGIYPYQRMKQHYIELKDKKGVEEITKEFNHLTMAIQENGINRPDLIGLVDFI